MTFPFISLTVSQNIVYQWFTRVLTAFKPVLIGLEIRYLETMRTTVNWCVCYQKVISATIEVRGFDCTATMTCLQCWQHAYFEHIFNLYYQSILPVLSRAS